MKRSNKCALASSAALLAALSGCADVPETETNLSAVEQEIIGGVAANSASLNAIGALTYHVPSVDEVTGETTTTYFPVCTASLISSQTLLTAKHCTEGFENPEVLWLPAESRLFFHMGPDAQKPVRVAEIVAVERAREDQGGLVGVGHDVATFHLLEKITDVTPLTLGTLQARQINQSFATVGYGYQDNTTKSGTRFAGTETLNALSGPLFQLMFSTLDSFREWHDWYYGTFAHQAGSIPNNLIRLVESVEDGGIGSSSEGGSTGSDSDAGTTGGDSDGGTSGSEADGGATAGEFDPAQYRYETTYLLEGYEAYTGNRPGNTQVCRGDSGGPLVKTVNGKLRAFGVASGALESKELLCDYGSVYATFGPDVLDFLNKSKKWVDPCKGLSTAGVCEKDVVKRCTSLSEGVRRITKTNCGLLAQTCGTNDDGTLGCVDR